MNEQEEAISDASSLSFRLGHAGDASTIASWYRTSNTSVESPKDEESDELPACGKEDSARKEIVATASSLEIWLEKGLGNEDTAPSLFALLSHVKLRAVDGRCIVGKLGLLFC